MTQKSKAWQQGYQTGFDDSDKDNPYKIGDTDYNDWKEGFDSGAEDRENEEQEEQEEIEDEAGE